MRVEGLGFRVQGSGFRVGGVGVDPEDELDGVDRLVDDAVLLAFRVES